MRESFISMAKSEWRAYRNISIANKYIKKARKLVNTDRELSLAYRDLAVLYQKRSKIK